MHTISGMRMFPGWASGSIPDPGISDATQLPKHLWNSFAYLSSEGVKKLDSSGETATFPMLVGEYGNVFDSAVDPASCSQVEV